MTTHVYLPLAARHQAAGALAACEVGVIRLGSELDWSNGSPVMELAAGRVRLLKEDCTIEDRGGDPWL